MSKNEEMTSIHFNLKTKPGMKLEFLQTMGSIIVDLHKVNGCMNIDFQQDGQSDDQFFIRLDWQSNQLLKAMFDSEEYGILEGAMKVLCEMPLVEISGVENKSITMEGSDLKGINLYERIKLEFNGD
jgi:quinol monooxygenase YgiN